MRFHITGDDVFLGGQLVATLDATVNATLRAVVEEFLDGRPLDCDEHAFNEGYREAERQWCTHADV